MSNHALNWARSLVLPRQLKFLLLDYADQADKLGECWPAHRRTRQRTGYSTRRIQEINAQLEERGLITIIRHLGGDGKRARPNTYRLHIPGPVDTSDRPGSPPSRSRRLVDCREELAPTGSAPPFPAEWPDRDVPASAPSLHSDVHTDDAGDRTPCGAAVRMPPLRTAASLEPPQQPSMNPHTNGIRLHETPSPSAPGTVSEPLYDARAEPSTPVLDAARPQPDFELEPPPTTSRRLNPKQRKNAELTYRAEQAGLTPLALYNAWNQAAGPQTFPRAQKLTPDREKALQQVARMIIEEGRSLEAWKAFVAWLADQPFYCGGGNNHWKVSFDWLLVPGNLLKTIERWVDATHGAASSAPSPCSHAATGQHVPQARFDDGNWSRPPEPPMSPWCERLVDAIGARFNPDGSWKDQPRART